MCKQKGWIWVVEQFYAHFVLFWKQIWRKIREIYRIVDILVVSKCKPKIFCYIIFPFANFSSTLFQAQKQKASARKEMLASMKKVH